MSRKLPLISIVTPSLNQGAYIEENIKSVLEQKYPHFEHIIIDGSSTDGTIDILMKYGHVKWVSEKDNGQSEAINKGFKMAKGEIIGWLNSDDCYEPNTLFTVIQELNSAEHKYVVFGDCYAIDEKGNRIGYGIGYYDIFLKGVDCPKIALGFDFQLVKKIPVEKHDVKVDKVITD